MLAAVRSRRHDRAIFGLALPALGALAADPLVSLVDTAFIGRLGAVPLAGVAIASAVFAALFAIFNFLEYTITPLVAGAVGAGDRREAGRLTTAAAALAVLGGVAATVILEAWGENILEAFGASGPVLEEATTYLSIRALALPAVLIVMIGHGAYRGYQDTRTPLIVTLGLNLVNLVLDPLLIFGLGWGVAGAAWATVAAQAVGAAAFLVLLFGIHRRALEISLGRPAPRTMGSLVGAGSPLILRNASLLATLTLATAVAARVGTSDVAAHQVGLQVWLFLALVVDALAIAGQAMVGKSLGADHVRTARDVSDRLLLLGLGFGLLLSTVLFVIGRWVGGVFTNDAGVVAAFGAIYVFIVVMQPLNALVFVWDGIAIGAAAFRYLAGTMLASAGVACTLLLLVIPLGWGLPGVWWGLVALMAARAATLWWWYGRGALSV